MSGHSKWHSIRHKKGAADAKRGKIFTKHAKLITIAARDGGGDPEMNAALRTAIANAKAENVPNANIDKAIKKGAGTGKDSADLKEIMYEGFGPAGTTFYVKAITDNTNRTVAAVKNIFAKNGGNLGEAGTVGWMYERKGMIVATNKKLGAEEAELAAIEAGAEDLTKEEGKFEIITEDTELFNVKEKLEEAGFEVAKAELTFLPKNEVKITEEGEAKNILQLADALEEDGDVSDIYSNFDIEDELLEKLSD